MNRALPAVWPEAPADYPLPRATFVPQIDPERIARALNDRAMINALNVKVWRQDIIDNQRRDRRAAALSSAFVVVGFVLGMAILVLGLTAFFAPQWLEVLPWNAAHTAEVIRG